MLAQSAWALIVLVFAPALLAMQDPGRAAEAGAARLAGTVMDRQTGRPVPAIDVVLAGVAGGLRITDDRGGFRFESLPAGTHRLTISGVGYHPVEDSVALAPGGTYTMSVTLVPRALALDPIVVVALVQPTLLDRVGFAERRESGLGTFLTRDAIEARNAARVSDLFRTVPGIRVLPGSRGAGTVVVMRGGCQPAIFIDGVNTVVSVGVDFSLSPRDLEAVEIYRGSQVPPQFRLNTCGAILFWTRAPQAEPGTRSFWRRLGVVGALVAMVVVLMR